MLVLSRKRNEKLIIGDSLIIDENIVITVVAIRGDKVRLGVEAPRKTPVHRQEVYEDILRGLTGAGPSGTAPCAPTC